MMAANPLEVTPVALPVSNATHYTVTTAKKCIQLSLVLCNTDTVDRAVTLNFVPNGGSAGVLNQIWADIVRTKETKPLDFSIFRGAGGTLQGFAAAAAVVGMAISPVEVD
jgi:hypothetical protein